MTTIVGLLFPSRPAAIAGLVISVFVGVAVESQVRRADAHIGEEVFENEPTVTNRNTASAVPFPLFAFWVEATLFHVSPRLIGSGHASFAHRGMAVLGLGEPFTLEASATGCVSARQIVADGDAFGSAIAAIAPARVRQLHVREFDDEETSESLTCKVSEIGHRKEIHV